MFKHTCIKRVCAKPYEDNDPDPYYCPSCNVERLALAKEIDAKIGSRPKRATTSALAEYDASPKVRGFVHVRI